VYVLFFSIFSTPSDQRERNTNLTAIVIERQRETTCQGYSDRKTRRENIVESQIKMLDEALAGIELCDVREKQKNDDDDKNKNKNNNEDDDEDEDDADDNETDEEEEQKKQNKTMFVPKKLMNV
jgi:hypothetical protein